MSNQAGSPSNIRRLGVVAAILKQPADAADRLNSILHAFAHLIVGRMGMPYKERGVSVISLIVDGTSDEIGALTGQLGQLPDVSVKTIFTKI